MNRMDRLMGIMLEIQASNGKRVEDLARHFETSKRTIYRDIQALCEMGVPLVGEPGRGYTLTQGYFLPPLAFTVDEAALLLLGVDAIASSFDTEYRSAAEWAGRKIESILPEDVSQRVAHLRDSLRIVNTANLSQREIETLYVLRRSIFKQQTVRFRYYARYPDDGHVSLRDADPYALVFVDGVWFMVGHCHLRKDRRMFRLSRIEDINLTPHAFQRPAEYRVRDEQHRRSSRSTISRVLFDEDALPWVMEDQFFYIQDRQETEEGLMVTLRSHNLDQIVPWIMGWGGRVRVLEPVELRQRIQQEARNLLQNHSESV
jgi:predicted DNA-binding transcriptional regulator YafY